MSNRGPTGLKRCGTGGRLDPRKPQRGERRRLVGAGPISTGCGWPMQPDRGSSRPANYWLILAGPVLAQVLPVDHDLLQEGVGQSGNTRISVSVVRESKPVAVRLRGERSKLFRAFAHLSVSPHMQVRGDVSWCVSLW